MDVLTDVLQTVRVGSACYGRLEATAPWGLSVRGGEEAKFHVVISGSCWLELEGEEQAVPLSSGDVVALPHGHPHVVRDDLTTPPEALEALIEKKAPPCAFGSGNECVLRTGGGGTPATLVGGSFRFEDRRSNPLLSALPPLIVLRGQGGRSIPWLDSTLKFIACEAASNRPGSQTVISRLADVLFIQIVRGHLASLSSDAPGWLRALAEPQIGAALSLIHETPETDWTVGSLATRVGMSRSAFASRFTRLVGEPPLHYVTRWRMQKAANLLRGGRITMAEIAGRVGYESEAAFSKAFKRALGTAPGAYRRAARSQTMSAAA